MAARRRRRRRRAEDGSAAEMRGEDLAFKLMRRCLGCIRWCMRERARAHVRMMGERGRGGGERHECQYVQVCVHVDVCL